MRVCKTDHVGIALRPGDIPYVHWARSMVGAGGRGAVADGRRLRRREGGEEAWFEPIVVALGPEPGSAERGEARRALLRRVEADELRMDAHETAILAEVAGAAHPPEREVYCAFQPCPGGDLEPGLVVVERGEPTTLPRRSLKPGPAGRRRPRREGDAPVIGVVDDGLAFLNARFRAAEDRTRFEAVWLQEHRPLEPPRGRRDTPFGRRAWSGRDLTHAGAVLLREDIDAFLGRGAALDEAAVYRRLGRAVSPDIQVLYALERAQAHGTHVLDLAAGAEPGSGDEAEAWPLLGVQLPPEAVSDSAGTHLRRLAITAVRWILHRAEPLGRGPVIVNVSFGALAGPKDGSRVIEWAVAAELERFEGRTGRPARVNWSFGNGRLHRQVARFEAEEPQGPIDWRLQPDDEAASFLEIRPDDPERIGDLRVRIALPGGAEEVLTAPEPKTPWTIEVDGRPALRLYRAPVPGPGGFDLPTETPHLVLAAGPTVPGMGREPRAPAGAHRVTLEWDGPPSAVWLEVQRGDTPVGHPAYGRQSYLDHPRAYGLDPETLGRTSPSGSPITRARTHTAHAHPSSPRVWTTGAARPGRDPDAPRPTRYAAAGATVEGSVRGPTISALAERGTVLRGLLAAGALSGTVRASSGSSAAAPCATRALALTLTRGRPEPGPEEARAVVEGYGIAPDPASPDLEPSDPPEPHDAARLGAGTVTPPKWARRG